VGDSVLVPMLKTGDWRDGVVIEVLFQNSEIVLRVALNDVSAVCKWVTNKASLKKNKGMKVSCSLVSALLPLHILFSS
jgi:hypothetical protein